MHVVKDLDSWTFIMEASIEGALKNGRLTEALVQRKICRY